MTLPPDRKTKKWEPIPTDKTVSVPTESRRPTTFHDRLADTLCNVAQLLDGWHADGTAWSEWDESVRQQVSQFQGEVELIRKRNIPEAASSSLLPVPSPLVDALQHGMNCPGLTPTRKDECTCGFEWRIRLRTEQEMHRAWKKRAEEAEAKLASLPVGRQPSYISELRLEGKGTDHIWLMEDGAEPHTIGIRLDSGDSGVVYVTPDQAKDLAEQLTTITSVASLPVGEGREPLPKESSNGPDKG